MSFDRGRYLALVGVVFLLGSTWAAIRLTGGGPPELADVSYVAAAAAGLSLGLVGGLAAGALALMLVSPLGPLSPPLPLHDWVTHGVLVTSLGATLGWHHELLGRERAKSRDLIREVTATYQRTLHLIAETIEFRDPITAGHSRRVAYNARALGSDFGLTSDELDALYWAGLLHDLGKLAMPDSVLQKPTDLTRDEWTIMRRHPRIGARLIRQTSPELAVVADAVATHHERCDGSGYPHGLSGDQIPLMGRILAVVDVFEALTSARPYRPPLDAQEALDHIVENSGHKFDPVVVKRFEALLIDQILVTANTATTCLVESPLELPTIFSLDAPPQFGGPVHSGVEERRAGCPSTGHQHRPARSALDRANAESSEPYLSKAGVSRPAGKRRQGRGAAAVYPGTR